MKVQAKNAGPCRKDLHIVVPAEAAEEEYDRTVQAFLKAARIPGFRKGKAPKAVVERHFEREIAKEVRERLVPRFYHEAVESKGLKPVAVVDVKEPAFVRGQDFRFSATVDVQPEFRLPRYKGVSLKGGDLEVTEKAVDEALASLRDRAASFEDVSDRAVETGDFVQVDFEGQCGGQPVVELVPDHENVGKAQGFWLLADPAQFSLLPSAFVDALLGLSIGAEKTVELDFPADFSVDALVGKKAVYQVTVRAIRAKKLPALDEKFVKSFEVEGIDALRALLRKQLQQEVERNEKARLRNQAINKLLEKRKIDVPEALVAQETQAAVRSIVRESAMRGATKAQIEQRSEEILKTARESSVAKVRLDYILARIAEEEQIGVGTQEVQTRIGTLAAAYRTTPDKLRSDLEKGEGMDRLSRDIVSEKTLDFIVENAKISR